jgi:uncharacterized membrane protein
VKILAWTFGTVAVLLCAYVGYNALHYLVPGHVGPDFIMHNAMAKPWLLVHAGFAAAALLLGPTQFVPALRRRAPALHRWMGRAFIVSALIGGASGLPLALGTAAGPIAATGFTGLAVLTLLCAVQAWRLAMARRFPEHREWAIRTFALLFAGVTLRLWLPLSMIAQLDLMESYRVISFLAWVPNLLLAELYLARGRAKRRSPAMPAAATAPSAAAPV